MTDVDQTPPPAPSCILPLPLAPVSDDLAGALRSVGTKGEGERALGLLRDAHRILTDPAPFQRQAEIAESCVRGAVEGLLKLGGKKQGLAAAARAVLKAVDAYRPPTPDVLPPQAEPARSRRSDPAAALERLRTAAEVLRFELDAPGGYHERRAAGIVEDRTGRAPGQAQKNALEVWGALYGSTSDTLHGVDSGLDVATDRYRTAVAAIADVFLPLIARRDQVLALLALSAPGEADAKALAALSDPRALDYFFQHRPAPGWLEVLDDHLLMPDATAAGAWPAFPYLDDLTATDPERVRAWLAERAGGITAAGPLARAALLRLAARRGIGLASQVRVLTVAQLKPGHRPDEAVPVLAAHWARAVPPAERGTDWVRTVETLLRATVEAAHDQAGARLALLQRLADAAEDDPGAEQELAALAEARLPDHEAAALMSALAAAAAHLAAAGPHAAGTTPAALAALLRTVTAVLLARDLTRTGAAVAAMVYADLDPGVVTAPGAELGPRLARTVLDIAAHDAAAGTVFAERTAEITGRVAAADPRLADRLLADHLTTTAPAPASDVDDAAGEWWEQTLGLMERLPASPDPQTARLTALAAGTCPPQHTGRLTAALTALLGPAPTHRDRTDHLAARAADPALHWPTPWLRAWDWSPVLPQAVLAPWADILATLRTHEPTGPRDPRDTRHPFAWTPSQPLTVPADRIAPGDDGAPDVLATAALLAAAGDAHDPRYRAALRTAVDRDPAAWAEDVARTVAALAHPSLQAAYLCALAGRAERLAVLPGGALAAAVRAALDLHRALPATPAGPAHPDGGAVDDPAPVLAADALFTLLTAAWRTDTDLGAELTADALAHLTRLTDPLTDPATPDTDDTSPFPTTASARALQALLEHAAHHTRTTAPPALPSALRPLLEAVLAAHPADARTAQA
ncbi:hypothetical protein ACFU6K_12040, partial [Kitasatospora sp. NPDC057512]|uniref:hypothetical protein n=1 Tax=Kitasatospora sp. NPDC057512 TaxID=3346154 RepID=UPI0036B1E94E